MSYSGMGSHLNIRRFWGKSGKRETKRGNSEERLPPPPLSLSLSLSPLPSPPSKISSAPVPKEGLILRLGEKKWKKAALKGFFFVVCWLLLHQET